MGVSSSKLRINGGLCEKSPKVVKRDQKEEEGGEGSEKPMFEKARVRATERESSVSYEREMMAMAFKKAEWKQERRRLREEVRALRALLEERERGHVAASEKAWGGCTDRAVMVEKMREERARRDEAVEKWKQLYLAIKMELDDLILRTHQGGLCWRAEEEDIAEEQRKKLKAKEETITELRSKVASMEQEMVKRDREVDILRQSLRIMSSKKIFQPKNQPKKVMAKQCGKIHVK